MVTPIERHSFHDRIGDVLSDKRIIALEITIIVLIILLNFLLPTLLLLLLGGISLWLRRKKWRDIGLSRQSNWLRIIFLGVAIGIAWTLLDFFILEPFIESITGVPPDLSVFRGLKGNVPSFAIWLTLTWTLAAFGEEIAFRGYFLSRSADLLGENKAGWALSLILTSVCFGLGHLYQGISGFIDAVIFAGVMGLIFLLSARNLWLPIMAHGINDTIAFTALFLGLYFSI